MAPPFDFPPPPAAPTTGQIVTGPNGAMYSWNGSRWVAVAGPTISGFVPITGGTMTGTLGVPSNGIRYGGGNLIALHWTGSQITVSVDGTGTPGALLPLSGGAMTGALTLSGNASAPLHPVPLRQLQTIMEGENKIFTGPSPPPSPQEGDLWFDTISNQLMVRQGGNWVLSTATVDGFLPLAGGVLTGHVYSTSVIYPAALLATRQAAGGESGGFVGSWHWGTISNVGFINLNNNLVFGNADGYGNPIPGSYWRGLADSAGNWQIWKALYVHADPADGGMSSFGLALIGSGFTAPRALAFGYGSYFQYRPSSIDMTWMIADVTRMWMSWDGELYTTGSMTPGSDARFKRDIRDASDGLTVLQQIQPKRFVRNETPPEGMAVRKEPRTELGFVAQDLQSVLPEAVVENNDRLSLDFMAIIGVLVNSVKELASEVAALKGAH